ncbi:RIB43A-domain-containing protein [Chytridium lagenaria]|nr:RIB43A-domain-containing protein [Chytridium lagenaria]
MYKVEIAQDTLQQAAITRRQKLDEDRKNRIFNPKTRSLGIDVSALEEQIRLKNEMKMVEKQRDLAFDRSMKYTNDILTMMDEHVSRTRREHLSDMNQFRKEYQKPEQGRDFDLYDPKAQFKDRPARIADDDSRCGVSGMQKFEGEDLGVDGRARQQKEQIRIWTEQQIYEKEMRRHMEMEEERNYEAYESLVTEKVSALNQAVKKARSDQAKSDKEINERLAALKIQKEREDKLKETEMNTREILNHMQGEFLTERPDVFNIKGGHKVRVDLFKGITPDQKAAILQAQENQRLEAEYLHRLGKSGRESTEAKWALQEASNHRASLLLEREKERRQRELAIQIRKQNESKAVDDRQRQRYIDKAYFGQFNTTSR